MAGMVDTAVAMTLRRRIKKRLKDLGLSMRAASLKAGLGTHFVRDLLDNELQSPKADNLARLAFALDTTTEWLLEERGDETVPGVPIMGVVGAGAHYKPYEDQGNLDFAERPPGAKEVYGAARVKGHSGYPVYRDGEVIYFTEFRDDVTEFIGEDVIAELGDGSMLLKTLGRQTTLGHFTLTSHNAPEIHDAEVLRVAAVRWIDRQQARK
jgi:phage repressor protein C with HTH and peptisase S24 domain